MSTLITEPILLTSSCSIFIDSEGETKFDSTFLRAYSLPVALTFPESAPTYSFTYGLPETLLLQGL